MAVDEDGSVRHVVKPCDEPGQRALARAGAPHERHRLPRLDDEIDVAQHATAITIPCIAEAHLAELDAARDRLFESLGAIAQDGLFVENGREPLHRRGPALIDIDDPAKGDHRPTQHVEIGQKRDELAERDLLVHNHGAAPPENERGPDANERGEQRMESAGELHEPHDAREIVFVLVREQSALVILLRIGLHNTRSGQILLRERREIAHLFLNGHEAFVDRGAELLHRVRNER